MSLARAKGGRYRRETSEGDSPLRSAGPPTPPGRTAPLSQGARRGRSPCSEPSRQGCQSLERKAAAAAAAAAEFPRPPGDRAPAVDVPTSAFSACPRERGAGSWPGRRQSGRVGPARPLAAVLHGRMLQLRRRRSAIYSFRLPSSWGETPTWEEFTQQS